jgi:hypothetical protein
VSTTAPSLCAVSSRQEVWHGRFGPVGRRLRRSAPASASGGGAYGEVGWGRNVLPGRERSVRVAAALMRCCTATGPALHGATCRNVWRPKNMHRRHSRWAKSGAWKQATRG